MCGPLQVFLEDVREVKRDVTKGNTYYYKLEDIDKTSGSTLHDAVEVKINKKANKRKNKK